jgi:geranylgeranyl diphosphate synthase type II
MDIRRRLEKDKALIESELARILSRGGNRLYEAMRYAVLGEGKRFRPLLVLSAAETLGGDPAAALPFACGIELIHSYSLVHDDLPCMDDDDERRGRPACHKAFGEDLALLAGDALLTLAFEIMAGAPLPAHLCPAKARILHEAARLSGMEGMIGGQLLDITFTTGRADVVEELMRKKTGALIILAVRAGALLARASKARLDALTEYADRVGLAFQIRDDLLDASEKSKKPGVDKPNFVSVFGRDEAVKRLESLVRGAVSRLRAASISSPSLRYLAGRLLEY